MRNAPLFPIMHYILISDFKYQNRQYELFNMMSILKCICRQNFIYFCKSFTIVFSNIYKIIVFEWFRIF